MFRNHLKIAFRSFKKNSTFTGLSMLGLSVAFAAALLLSMAAFFQFSYDKFHKNLDNLYQVYSVDQTLNGPETDESMPIPYAATLQKEVPGVAKITRYLEGVVTVRQQDKKLNLDIAFVDNDFFSMFSFPVISGNSIDPLQNQQNIVLTAESAKKLYGSTAVVGKTLTISYNERSQNFVVSAVLKNFPKESSISFGAAVNFSNSPGYRINKNNWDASNHNVYLQLKQGVSAEGFEQRSHDFTALHFQDDIENSKQAGAQPNKNGFYKHLKLLPFKAVHGTHFKNGRAVASIYPVMLLGIALLIVFIAGVNYINMKAAKSTQGLQEIGMRKILGAHKKDLFLRFWIEGAFTLFLSLILGVLLAGLLLNNFKALFHTAAGFQNAVNPWVIGGGLLVFFILTYFSGVYPLLILRRAGVINALKGKLSLGRKNYFRNSLMAVQFAITVFLIAVSLVLWKQLDYMGNKDLGFDTTQVIAFPLNGQPKNFIPLFRNELRDNPKILSITASSDILGLGKDGYTNTHTWSFNYKNKRITTNYLAVDYDYINTLGLALVKGRSFDKNRPADRHKVLINQAMAQALGEENPLGVTIEDDTLYTVVGVLKNYNFQRLQKKIEPLTIFLSTDKNQLAYVYVKVTPNSLLQSFKAVKQAWNKLAPGVPFSGSFLDENIERTFRSEQTFMTIAIAGSLIAIVLSCMGLFAVTLLTVAKRTKEIGVRKVLGASISTIMFILIKDFLKLIGGAFLFAVPLAWWVSAQWLQKYAYRIELSVWVFLIAGCLTVLIALLTMSFKTIRAAMANPVKSLRTE